jgi:hypothetical protein
MKKILFLFALQVILFTVKAQERRADRLFDRWDYAKASTIYQRKINRKPSADLYYQLGICYRKMSAHFKDEEAAFAKVEEYGLTNNVKIAPNTEKIIKKPAMNIVVSIVTLPKKSKWRPIMNSTIPIRIQLS